MAYRALKRFVGFVVGWLVAIIAIFHIAAAGSLVLLRWINPPTTTVQIERRVQAWIHGQPYHKRYTYVPLNRISPDLQHAVISAEDGRFYEHHGIDWKEVQQVIDQDLEDRRVGRGASTITQQLLKNLFLSTHRSFLYKGLEFTLAPVADRILPKQRVLELYLNVIEWGPGIYGAEEAARGWYGKPASQVNRIEAARLAAVIPSPLRRKPARMTAYSNAILRRMTQRSW